MFHFALFVLEFHLDVSDISRQSILFWADVSLFGQYNAMLRFSQKFLATVSRNLTKNPWSWLFSLCFHRKRECRQWQFRGIYIFCIPNSLPFFVVLVYLADLQIPRDIWTLSEVSILFVMSSYHIRGWFMNSKTTVEKRISKYQIKWSIGITSTLSILKLLHQRNI